MQVPTTHYKPKSNTTSLNYQLLVSVTYKSLNHTLLSTSNQYRY